MRKTLLVVLLLGLVMPLNTRGAVAQDSGEIQGVWQSLGYGWILDIQPETATIYQVSSASCVVVTHTDGVDYTPDKATISGIDFPGLAGVLGFLEDIDLSVYLDENMLILETGIAPVRAAQLEAVPAVCQPPLPAEDDPIYNFEAFWNMYHENYAFFDLYDVDWQAIYDAYRPLITPTTTPEELSTIFTQMIADLDDGHVFFFSNFEFFAPSAYPDWTDNGDEDLMLDYVELVLDDYVGGDYESLANDQIIYGWLTDEVGYINILGMEGFGEDLDDIDALAEAMPVVMQDLAEAETLVLDIRFNGGGSDDNSIYIAGYFTDTPVLGFAKQPWDGQQFLAETPVYIEPLTDEPFTGDVYLLTSGVTASAAEIFTMSMRALPHVTLVGEATWGALSDIMFVFLPNGWLTTISNERYIAHDGQYFEEVGVPPYVEVSMAEDALDQDIDPVLDAVLALIAES